MLMAATYLGVRLPCYSYPPPLPASFLVIPRRSARWSYGGVSLSPVLSPTVAALFRSGRKGVRRVVDEWHHPEFGAIAEYEACELTGEEQTEGIWLNYKTVRTQSVAVNRT